MPPGVLIVSYLSLCLLQRQPGLLYFLWRQQSFVRKHLETAGLQPIDAVLTLHYPQVVGAWNQ
jgi:hypothetical protein